ncbi:uncharacterized protein LOC128307197 isoform X2 [Anopheles moucheti]|uniref:uncharacterized protein LOC128307197 isoform X2 n=1 Tax=Anopheles moucheti TaxID=186751 RepID=UPI0022F01487|nr:uncharacterized protein LOC128307197 isoform X2 [Anopheles moucheti]XP_052900897.1 uncharacterized protein LOC128307197 isoform X2 [Anopheles moucheti]
MQMVQRETELTTARRSKRSVAGGTPDTEPNAIVSEQRFEGLALEGVSPQHTHNAVEVKTAADNAEVEAINREEEIIKKRKTELTTTRQIETRVKRQLLFEDGKVVEDSGPIVSTNTTEDTDKQETVQTEHRTLGDPDAVEADESGNRLAGAGQAGGGDANQHPTLPVDTVVSSNAPKTTGGTIVARPPDGLLRNIKEEVVVSREETKERTEVTEQKQFGDFTDDAYLRAINSGVDDIRELLLSEKARTEQTPTGPQLVQQSISSRKVIDSEDTDIRQLAKPDGTLVTEKEQTRQHEELYDDELPETDEQRLLPGYDQVDSGERVIDQKSSAQRYFKQRDEQHVDLIGPNGEVIGHEMRYAAEQTQMDKDGGVGGDGGRGGDTGGGLLSDWDSLSDRLRKARRLGRHPKDLALVGQPGTNNLPGVVPVLNDRLDALTKKPLDFDKEEETRKQETSKWLESHFGSESRSSRDSREDLDELVEPTKRTYFNVTIKSGDTVGGPTAEPDGSGTGAPYRPGRGVPPGTAHFQGVSEWTADRTGQRGITTSREDLLLEGSSHDAGYRSGERHRSGSEDARPVQRQLSSVQPGRREDVGVPMYASAYLTTPRPKTNGERNFNARYGRSVSPDRHSIGQTMPDGRPTVPQRRKVLERRQVAVQQQQQQHQLQQQQQPYHSKPIVHGYAPRSRSVSPIQIPPVVTTLRKPYQKTRFSSIQDLSHAGGPQHQQVQRAASRAQSTPPKANRVGSAIGNSIRKLMGKIRSASAERKFKLKNTKQQLQQHHQRSQSPTPSALAGGQNKRQSTTYQQYNVIDGHISSSGGSPLLNHHHHHPQHTSQYGGDDQRLASHSQSQFAASHKLNGAGGRRESDRARERNYTERRGSSDILSDMTTGSGGPTPRQKYYLGENPYGGSIFGKENKYNPAAAAAAAAAAASAGRDRREERVYTSSHTRSFSQPPQTNLHTLSRFSKSTNRLPTSAGGGTHYEHDPGVQYHPGGSGYGVTSSQTLPRNDQHRLQRSKPLHSSTINVSIVNTVNTNGTKPLANTGPVKPARTYKALNRSKSFNVHGLNGTNDPSPIYLEKLSRGPATAGNGGTTGIGAGFYRSNSHLDQYATSRESPLQLKSPSIVNLVSRSTRDLTQSGDYYPNERTSPDGPTLDKKNVFLRNLQNRAPELYRTLHGGGADPHTNGTPTSREYLNTYITREQEQTIGIRSPVTINKDTASIVRRGSSSTDDYPDSYRLPARRIDANEHQPGGTQPRTKHYYKKTTSPSPARLDRNVVGGGRYRAETDLKYQDMPGGGGGGGVVIELRSKS